MEEKNVLHVEFGADGGFSVKFSDEFLALSLEDQIQALEGFYKEKSLEANSVKEISYDLGKSEQVLMLAEALLGRLKCGKRIEGGTDFEISLEELMYSPTRVPIV